MKTYVPTVDFYVTQERHVEFWSHLRGMNRRPGQKAQELGLTSGGFALLSFQESAWLVQTVKNTIGSINSCTCDSRMFKKKWVEYTSIVLLPQNGGYPIGRWLRFHHETGHASCNDSAVPAND
jgi:hypothetical protein